MKSFRASGLGCKILVILLKAPGSRALGLGFSFRLPRALGEEDPNSELHSRRGNGLRSGWLRV